MTATLHLGDCREVMASMGEASVDAIVCDPPYGLEFMGKGWDHGAPGVPFWTEALRVLKPGGHLLAFGGTRTFHRLTCAIEDAGFEVRDCLSWLYGSGFPKSLDVSKAIDKAAGAEREVVGVDASRAARLVNQRDGSVSTGGQWEHGPRIVDITAPATDAAKQWDGWGTALKPAWEPIILARRPLVGTVAANVLAHGTGALNVDGCRVKCAGGSPAEARRESARRAGRTSTKPGCYDRPLQDRTSPDRYMESRAGEAAGRWPANVLLDPEAAAMLDEQSGERASGTAVGGLHRRSTKESVFGHGGAERIGDAGFGDSGGASRFFYTAKTSSSERHGDDGANGQAVKNDHPTVKPVDLMAYLVKLVTPPEGTVLDPFMGSGSTGIAALRLGVEFVGIEREEGYLKIAEARIREDAPLFNSVEVDLDTNR